MIKVSYNETGISILGHAEYAAYGQDIVCSAVSVLAQNMVQSIETLTQDTIKYDMQPGMVHIHFENLSAYAQVLVDSFFVGIQAIAAEYPNNVQIV